MEYFAAAFARTAAGWTGSEVELAEVETIDDVIEIIRDAGTEHGSPDSAVVLLVEADDEWFAVVRLGPDGEPRVFLSDVRAPATSDLAAILSLDPEPDQVEPDDDDEENRGPALGGEPGGDAELLTDLGVAADQLIGLSVAKGVLPGDALSRLAEAGGYGEELDRLR